MGGYIQKTITIATTILCCMTGCGAIIGANSAENDSAQNYPFFVSVHVGSTRCGGTIVGPNAILTSAECLFDPRRRKYVRPDEIAVFKPNDNGPPTRYSCERFTPHWMYLWFRWMLKHFAPYDIAVIKLRECIDLRMPQNLRLKSCPLHQGYREGYAVGMGQTELEESLKQGQRRKKKNAAAAVTLPRKVLLRQDEGCSNFMRESGAVVDTNSQLCFQSTAPGGSLAGLLTGDFGGPLVYKDRFIMCLLGIANASVLSRDGSQLISFFSKASYHDVFIRNALDSLLLSNGCEIL